MTLIPIYSSIEFELIPANLRDPAHAAFVYDLISACREEMLDDYCDNILVLMEEAHQRILSGQIAAFLVRSIALPHPASGHPLPPPEGEGIRKPEGEGIATLSGSPLDGTRRGLENYIGAIWLEFDRNDIAKIHGGLLPEYRQGFLAVRIFREFIRWAFETLPVRKLEAWMPLHCRAAEAVLRYCGFLKEGLIKAAYTVDGRPHPVVLLGLTREESIELSSSSIPPWRKLNKISPRKKDSPFPDFPSPLAGEGRVGGKSRMGDKKGIHCGSDLTKGGHKQYGQRKQIGKYGRRSARRR